MFKKSVVQKSVLTLLLFSAISCFSQWKTAVSNNIVDDITITYEVVYERQLTAEEKNSTQYVSKITTTFDRNHMIERRFGNKPKAIEHYSLFDYKSLQGYSCSIFGNLKKRYNMNLKSLLSL